MPVVALVLALAVVACGPGGDSTVAATVNGEDIPVSTIEARFASIASNPDFASQVDEDTDGRFAAQVQASLLSGMIESQAVRQGAEAQGIDVTDADVERRITDLIEEMGGQEAFDAAVEQAALSEEEVFDQIRDLVYRERVQERLVEDVSVTDADVEEYYDSVRETRYERATARHILVETEDEARGVLGRLDSGEDFADIARDVSSDPGSAENGGDLGEFGRGQMVGAFDEAVFSSEVGEVLGPVETDFGYHVIEVTGRVSESLEDVADAIREELDDERSASAIQDWIREQLAAAEVTVNPRFGEWDAEGGRVMPGGSLSESPSDGDPEGGGDR
jgi:parvulin-like peptidyl-prolyl isomerase